jgi:hypothetical protein
MVCSEQEETVKRTVIVGVVFAVVVAVLTGSVLLLGYAIAGASLLLGAGLLVRKALHRSARASRRSYRSDWLDVNDREAA